MDALFSYTKAVVFIALIGFLPGWLICHWLRLRQNLLVWSHALSVLIFSVTLWLHAQLSIPLSVYLPTMIGALTAGIFLLFWRLGFFNRTDSIHIAIGSAAKSTISDSLKARILPVSIIFLVVLVYLSIVDVYDLVPSDILRHMERIQAALRDITNPALNDFYLFNGASENYHYYFYAYLMSFSALPIVSTFWIVTLLNSTLLLVALYNFSLYISDKQENPKATFFLAILCLLFFVLTKGIAGFSFIRYYSLAPTLLSYAVFLVLITKIDYCFRKSLTKPDAVMIASALLMLLLWHVQELLFVLIISGLLVFYYCLNSRSIRFNNLVNSAESELQIAQRPWLLFCLILSVIVVIASMIIYATFDPPSSYSNKIVTLAGLLDVVLPANTRLPVFTQHINFLNPFIQFSQVLGFWGVVVYACSILYWRALINKPLLICGLLIPFVTVFNPIFVDVFLRIRGEDVLYRLLYAIPLSAVAAFIVFESCCNLREHIVSKNNVSKTSILQSGIAMFSIIAITLSLVPFKSATSLTQYNRLADMLPVERQQSLRHWQDLSKQLAELPPQDNVLTDPLTGYIITATTKSIAKRYKFTTAQHLDLNSLDLTSSKTNPFAAFQGHYLVINLRDGANSKQGELSQHWSPTVLNVSNYYSQALLDHIRVNKQQFILEWHNDDVWLYRIN